MKTKGEHYTLIRISAGRNHLANHDVLHLGMVHHTNSALGWYELCTAYGAQQHNVDDSGRNGL